MMQAALDLDPKFVEAWGWLLRSQSYLYRNYEPTEARLAACKASYATLMRLAPDSRAAILGGARYYLWCLGDFERAIEQTERFIRLQPNDPEGYFLLEVIQFRQGRIADAIANLRKSIALEPTNPNYHFNIVGPLNSARRYEEVIQEYQTILKLLPDTPGIPAQLAFATFHSRGSTREAEGLFASMPPSVADSPETLVQRATWAAMHGDLAELVRLDAQLPEASGNTRVNRTLDLAAALAAQGDLAAGQARLAPLEAEALARAERTPTNHGFWRNAAAVAGFLGHADRALHCTQQLEAMPPEGLNASQTAARNATTRAFVYTWLGDKTRAIDEYTKLFRMPFGNLNVYEMRLHPRYAPLHGDPRFEALLNDPKNNAPLF